MESKTLPSELIWMIAHHFSSAYDLLSLALTNKRSHGRLLAPIKDKHNSQSRDLVRLFTKTAWEIDQSQIIIFETLPGCRHGFTTAYTDFRFLPDLLGSIKILLQQNQIEAVKAKLGQAKLDRSFELWFGQRVGHTVVYLSGMRISDISYDGNVQHGDEIHYFANGRDTIKKRTQYVQGRRQGPSLIFNDNGDLWWRLHFVDNRTHGESETFSAPGIIRMREQYQTDHKIATAEAWDDTGVRTALIHYDYPSLLHGVQYYWWPNGHPRAITTFHRGIKCGPYEEYNEEGIMTEKGVTY